MVTGSLLLRKLEDHDAMVSKAKSAESGLHVDRVLELLSLVLAGRMQGSGPQHREHTPLIFDVPSAAWAFCFCNYDFMSGSFIPIFL